MGVRVRSLLLGLAALTLAAPATARVRVEIISGTSPVEFLVTTTAHYPFIHSTKSRKLDRSFVASGSPKVLWTGAPNPLLFARFFTQVYHPEYVYVLQ